MQGPVGIGDRSRINCEANHIDIVIAMVKVMIVELSFPYHTSKDHSSFYN